jgi:cyclophilin family peptidyl-prolyl cis-trans isomerase
MAIVKDIVKDNKKILLLTLGLFLMSILGVYLLNSNILNVRPAGIDTGPYTQPREVLQQGVDYKARIRTIYGDIEVDLYEEQSPNAVNSFVFLSGENFYDGLIFHKVISNLVIQAGDQVGDGKGTPGYSLELDMNQLEVGEYSVCMANASQFFIVPRGADTTQLQEYPVLGKVTSGFSVVDAIERVTVDEEYKPLNDVEITSVLIIEE